MNGAQGESREEDTESRIFEVEFGAIAISMYSNGSRKMLAIKMPFNKTPPLPSGSLM